MSMANKMRVLIIDDNEDVTEAISDYLESIGDSCTSLNDEQIQTLKVGSCVKSTSGKLYV